MTRFRVFISRIAGVFRRTQNERHLRDELQFHIDMETDRLREAGIPKEEATRMARRNFGGMDQIKETYRDQRTLPFLEVLFQDIGHAARSMLRKPALHLIVLFTFALGIGVNTAVFSVVDAVLLKPLPFPNPEELVRTGFNDPKTGKPLLEATAAEAARLRGNGRMFAGVAAFSMASRTLTDSLAEPVHTMVGRLSGDLFAVLRKPPAAGRSFLQSELSEGQRVVVLSGALWQKRYGSRRDVVGQYVRIDNDTYQIVGVAGAGVLPKDVDLWRPLTRAEQDDDDRELQVVARLNPGVGSEPGMWTESMQSVLVRDVASPLLVQLGAVGLVMLIACVNVANLLLAQTWRREREIAIRAALGASRLRIVRQVMTETFVMAALGGLVGIVAGGWSLELVRAMSPRNLPRLDEVSLDGRVLIAVSVLTALAGAGAALFPAFHIARTETQRALKAAGYVRRSTSGLRQALIVIEISLATVLLFAAGLVLKSVERMAGLDRGYQSRHIITVPIGLRAGAPPDVRSFYESVLEQARSLPGVERAALAMRSPAEAGALRVPFRSRESPAYGKSRAQLQIITPDYFSVIGLPIRSGRSFDMTDTRNSRRVAIVNETLVRMTFGPQPAVGRLLRSSVIDGDLEIVAVVADTVSDTNVPQGPGIYVPLQQLATTDMTLLLRTSVDVRGLAPTIRSRIWSLLPSVPLDNIQTLDQQLSDSIAGPRFHMTLLIFFAALSIALASVGVYGIIADWVGEREHEIGIRRALGESETDILRMVLGGSLRLTICGTLFGILGTLWLERPLGSLLFHVTTHDPSTFAMVCVTLISVSIIAAVVPAWRASHIDPVQALKV